jgi:dUTP pyrophosphatase
VARQALILYPATYSQDRLSDVQEFAYRLLRRGISAQLKPSADIDEPNLNIEGEIVCYETLWQQSQTWMFLPAVKFQRLSETAILPTRGSFDCAGVDLYANFSGPVKISPGEVLRIPTGFAIELPMGYYAQVEDRSSMGAKGFAVRGGVIDRDYRGEIQVMLQFVAPSETPPTILGANDRVAQLVLVAYADFKPEEVDRLTLTVRANGGFGSTGR